MATAELPAFFKEYASKAALKLGFSPEHTIHFESGSSCNGLVGEIQKIIIREGSRQQIIFGKHTPLDTVRREQYGSIVLFKREIDVYSQVLPALFEFQKSKGVLPENGFFGVPECYLTCYSEKADESLILMEDLSSRNLKNLNKLKPLGYDHVMLVMATIGKFHALSFAVRDQRPELFEQIKLPDILLPIIKANDQLVTMFGTALEGAISLLDPEDLKAQSKMKALHETYMSTLETCLNGSLAEPYTVLNHGDCWTNNLMFDSKDNHPSELVVIDWQLARYTSPALDISYFLFCCTDAEFRKQHYEEALRRYHSALSDMLSQLGSDPDRLFPYDALQDQLKRFARFAIVLGAFDIAILCTDPAEMPDLNGDVSEGFANSPAAQLRYAERMKGAMVDAISYGYLE